LAHGRDAFVYGRASQPNGRLIDPNEVAWPVAFLACDSGLMTVVNFDQAICCACDSAP